MPTLGLLRIRKLPTLGAKLKRGWHIKYMW